MKVGVIGYGSIGSRHALNLEMLGHQVVVYDPAVRRDVKHEKDVYDECDAIVLATPTIYHSGGIRACAERGKHFLIEKPIGRALGDLQEMLDIAAAKSAIVMMGNNLRFHPCVQQAKRWIDAGDIDTPTWAHFTCSNMGQKYISDGVILNTGAHEVDVAMHLFGPVREVLCANAHTIGGDDTIADFVLQHEFGVRSSFHLDIVTPSDIREAWIVGNKDKIGLELINRHSSLGKATTSHGGSFDDDYVMEIKAFIDRVEGKDVPGATGVDGLETLKVLLDVRKEAGLA